MLFYCENFTVIQRFHSVTVHVDSINGTIIVISLYIVWSNLWLKKMQPTTWY